MGLWDGISPITITLLTLLLLVPINILDCQKKPTTNQIQTQNKTKNPSTFAFPLFSGFHKWNGNKTPTSPAASCQSTASWWYQNNVLAKGWLFLCVWLTAFYKVKTPPNQPTQPPHLPTPPKSKGYPCRSATEHLCTTCVMAQNVKYVKNDMNITSFSSPLLSLSPPYLRGFTPQSLKAKWPKYVGQQLYAHTNRFSLEHLYSRLLNN